MKEYKVGTFIELETGVATYFTGTIRIKENILQLLVYLENNNTYNIWINYKDIV